MRETDPVRGRGLPWRRWAWAALAFAVGYGLLRIYWAMGGRWGYTACDRTRETAGVSSGCGAEHLATLPFWQGWGAVALCGVLACVAAATLRRGRTATVAAWAACAALVTMSFPLHLLFQIPAGIAGRPTDWRDVVNRLLLLGGGMLLGAAAAARSRRCSHPRADGPQPVPSWVRRWAAAAVAVPLLGWTVPHGLWTLGVPFGIDADELTEITQNAGLAIGVAITVVPGLASLLTLGLARRWGQIFPLWVPRLAGRPVPRTLALIPAATVAVTLIFYGLISAWVLIDGLMKGTVFWSELTSEWAAAATLLVFLGWGVTLGVTTLGYYRITRLHCETCASALPT